MGATAAGGHSGTCKTMRYTSVSSHSLLHRPRWRNRHEQTYTITAGFLGPVFEPHTPVPTCGYEQEQYQKGAFASGCPCGPTTQSSRCQSEDPSKITARSGRTKKVERHWESGMPRLPLLEAHVLPRNGMNCATDWPADASIGPRSHETCETGYTRWMLVKFSME